VLRASQRDEHGLSQALAVIDVTSGAVTHTGIPIGSFRNLKESLHERDTLA